MVRTDVTIYNRAIVIPPWMMPQRVATVSVVLTLASFLGEELPVNCGRHEKGPRSHKSDDRGYPLVAGFEEVCLDRVRDDSGTGEVNSVSAGWLDGSRPVAFAGLDDGVRMTGDTDAQSVKVQVRGG